MQERGRVSEVWGVQGDVLILGMDELNRLLGSKEFRRQEVLAEGVDLIEVQKHTLFSELIPTLLPGSQGKPAQQGRAMYQVLPRQNRHPRLCNHAFNLASSFRLVVCSLIWHHCQGAMLSTN